MRVALLTTDNREHYRQYHLAEPQFGPAVQALLEGFGTLTGVEIHVISCTQRAMAAPEKLSANIWFHLLEVPKLGWLRTGYQGCIRASRRKLQEIEPSIVHGQGTERDCAIAAIFSGFPNVITIHGNMRAVARCLHAKVATYLWCAAQLERFTLPHADGILCNSAYTRAMVAPLSRRTWDVPNAIRLAFFETELPNALAPVVGPKLLNIGAVDTRKRQLALFALARRLRQDGLRFEVLFVGGADNNTAVTREFFTCLSAPEMQGYTRYLGILSTNELLRLIDQSAALVHIPTEEAFGLVVAEALARDLKFFGTNVGGIPEIAAGVDGAELFEVGDETGLCRSISEWLRAGSPRPTNASSTMRRKYHPRVIAARHVEIYRELLAQL